MNRAFPVFGRQIVLALTLCAGLMGGLAAQEKPNSAIDPQPRKDDFWVKRHESFLEIARQGNVDLLFLGDSITQGWGGAGKDAWAKHFGSLKPANFGIGGDRTQHVLWRITQGKELEGIDPKAVVLMIGTNNASTNSAEEIAQGVKAIVMELRKQKPQAKILVLGVFPRSGTKVGKEVAAISVEELHPKIAKINLLVGQLADGEKVMYKDISSAFLSEEGKLTRSIMPDYLHLSPAGYEIWANAIKTEVDGMLK